MTPLASSLAPIRRRWTDIFHDASVDAPYIEINDWSAPVQYFVGRNGSGKSRAARSIAAGAANTLMLQTDRMTGISPNSQQAYGTPLSDKAKLSVSDSTVRNIRANQMIYAGAAGADQLLTLREQPAVLIKVVAFLRRVFKRSIEMAETDGYLDPRVHMGSKSYSLLGDEGHGLRELVMLLTAVYRPDWHLLVVDEPELHLHPSLVRMWATELNTECARSGRRAIVVTHEPTLIRPATVSDLDALWLFSPGSAPIRVSEAVEAHQRDRVTASLKERPNLISQLMFAPRPVLTEGPSDVAALTVALQRTQSPEVVAQTELIDCSASTNVALWFDIAGRLGLDVRGILDLDAVFDPSIHTIMEKREEVQQGIADEFKCPPRNHLVIKPLLDVADRIGVPKDVKSRAEWLASHQFTDPGLKGRKEALLRVWQGAGMWVHPQGTLESVLNLSSKGVSQARAAAESPTELDAVAAWVAFKVDPSGDVLDLLNVEVEKVAHDIQIRQREAGQPLAFINPPGTRLGLDQMVEVIPLPDDKGSHRLVVKTPSEFVGFWLEFSRETSSLEMVLNPPEAEG